MGNNQWNPMIVVAECEFERIKMVEGDEGLETKGGIPVGLVTI